jgi:Pyruvate/2-oxoacid:ferredoxin oxidoreductase delta subunit
MSTTKAVKAKYAKNRGFLCGNHVLYCPDLSKASDKVPFYLYCPTHALMYEIDVPSQGAEFIAEFPHGCKATVQNYSP